MENSTLTVSSSVGTVLESRTEAISVAQHTHTLLTHQHTHGSALRDRLTLYQKKNKNLQKKKEEKAGRKKKISWPKRMAT